MLVRHLRLLTLLPFLVLTTDPPAGDPPANDPPAGDPPANDPNDGELGEKGKKALDAEREARKAAERQARDAQAELDRIKADAKKREEDEAAEQGRYKELAETREAELTSTKDTLTTVQTERDALLELVKADVDAAWNDVPEEVRDLFEGDDDDVLAKKKHLTRSAKLIARLSPPETTPGHRSDPKNANGVKPNTESDKQARAAMRPRM